MNPKRRSLAESLAYPMIGMSCSVMLLGAGVSYLVVKRSIEAGFRARLQVNQDLFLASVSQDILTGSDSEVYRKCQEFFKDQLVQKIQVKSLQQRAICDLSKLNLSSSNVIISTPLFFDERHRELASTIEIAYSQDDLNHAFVKYFLILFVTIAILTAGIGFAARVLSRNLSRPIADLAKKFKSGILIELVNLKKNGSSSSISEVETLLTESSLLAEKLIDSEKKLILRERSEAIYSVATQVAHDIRSPLAALAMAEKDLSILPEDTRVLIRSAVGRIRDIANQLLEESRVESKNRHDVSVGTLDTSKHVEEASIQLIFSPIEGIITEKRMQFRSRIGIEFEGRLDARAYGLFANFQLTEFKRMISNLIDNSVEAVCDNGHIMITVCASEAVNIEIRIVDNGKGIPSAILGRLGARGETHGKEGGSGLGLFHARTSVESWGGKFSLYSEVGRGTTVVINLPRAAAPTWFVENLSIAPHSKIVILDDDESIHRVWQGRADSARLSDFGIQLVHLSTPSQLRSWNENIGAVSTNVRFLLDHELLGFRETGLDLISELKIAHRSVLVTSRYEEPTIRGRCRELQVRLIPKGMAGFVPITISV